MKNRRAKIWWFSEKQLISMLAGSAKPPIFPADTQVAGATFCVERQSFGLILINNQWPLIPASIELPSYVPLPNKPNQNKHKKNLEKTVTSIFDGFVGSHKNDTLDSVDVEKDNQ